jgi:hypothetical protein
MFGAHPLAQEAISFKLQAAVPMASQDDGVVTAVLPTLGPRHALENDCNVILSCTNMPLHVSGRQPGIPLAVSLSMPRALTCCYRSHRCCLTAR